LTKARYHSEMNWYVCCDSLEVRLALLRERRDAFTVVLALTQFLLSSALDFETDGQTRVKADVEHRLMGAIAGSTALAWNDRLYV